MSTSEIAFRYAEALFRLTSTDKELEVLLHHFTLLEALLGPSSGFLAFMLSPQIAQASKENLIKKNFASDGNTLFVDFLLLLLKKGRFATLPAVVNHFQKMAKNKLGLLDVALITTVPIDDSTKKRLQEALDKKFHKKTTIHEKVQSDLLGGAILMIGNKMMDSSIKGKLLKLRKHLLREAI